MSPERRRGFLGRKPGKELQYGRGFPSCILISLIAFAGDDGIRTHDPLLAGQVLSQLSYTPVVVFRFTSTGIRTHDRVSRWRIRQDSRALAGCLPFPASRYASAGINPLLMNLCGSLKIEQQLVKAPISGTRVIPEPFSLERR